MNGDMGDISSIPGMPKDADNMTMKEIKEFVSAQQQIVQLKKNAIQKICWDEIGEVCKKHNCMVKPVVQLHEMENGQYTFYADLVVVSMELPDEQPSGESDGESNSTEQTGERESTSNKNNEVREGE